MFSPCPQNLYEMTLARQAARVLSERSQGLTPDTLLITREDLLGPMHLDVSKSAALQELASLRGLKEVKQQVSHGGVIDTVQPGRQFMSI